MMAIQIKASYKMSYGAMPCDDIYSDRSEIENVNGRMELFICAKFHCYVFEFSLSMLLLTILYILIGYRNIKDFIHALDGRCTLVTDR